MYFTNRHYDILYGSGTFFLLLPHKLNSWQILIVTEKRKKRKNHMNTNDMYRQCQRSR